MTAPAKSSRWGSFLQQAVAGVESRLDDILADTDDSGRKEKPAPIASTTTLKPEPVSRSASSGSSTNDRLQERLAKALATKNAAAAAAKGDGTPQSSTRSRASSPLTVGESPRLSNDSSRPTWISQRDLTTDDATIETIQGGQQDELELQNAHESRDHTSDNGRPTASPRASTESNRASIPRSSIDSARKVDITSEPPLHLATNGETSLAEPPFKSNAKYEAELSQLRSDLQTCELQRQEEVHGYIERIDGLQAKLQYLAKESADAARTVNGSAPPGSMEKRVAEKDEQIAQLMEEGQQLSKKEISNLTTIKKLRAKIDEDSKGIVQVKAKQEKSERDLAIATERWKQAQSKEKQLVDRNRRVSQLQKDTERLKNEKETQEATIKDLRFQLEDALAADRQAEIKFTNDALEKERKRVADLEEDLANLRIEKNLVADRGQAQVAELKEKLERDAEQARVASLEMKTEQQILESRLEVMRARAEEVSSGATGVAQAKLLRQIETLQTQYAVASENWQGIEASLVAKATTMEKERDDVVRKEADLRRKAREITLKSKRQEEELEETKSKLPSFQQEIAENKPRLEALQRRAEAAEAALIEARSTFEKEKQVWATEMQQRIDEEKSKWSEDATGRNSQIQSRAESPAMTTRKGLTPEFLGLQNIQMRRPTSRSSNSEGPSIEKFMGRRPSNHPPPKAEATPPRQDSTMSMTSNCEMPDTPSIQTMDHDDFFENHRSASPQQTINDIASASTAAAGPSVQLVERMSSAVRRLESEKVASKEDTTRLVAQRDEARAEILSLMKEVEAKRATDQKVAELEEEIQSINGRYQTTLEMLGEKSELVEELRSDIDDIKAMYRDLVERTVQ